MKKSNSKKFPIKRYNNFKSYYNLESREVHSFHHNLAADRTVHILGTGTVGYHTSAITVNFYELWHKRMVDILFSIQTLRLKIPMICVQREKDWLSKYEVENETEIYSQEKNNDALQTTLCKENIFVKHYPKVRPTITEEPDTTVILK